MQAAPSITLTGSRKWTQRKTGLSLGRLSPLTLNKRVETYNNDNEKKKPNPASLGFHAVSSPLLESQGAMKWEELDWKIRDTTKRFWQTARTGVEDKCPLTCVHAPDRTELLGAVA